MNYYALYSIQMACWCVFMSHELTKYSMTSHTFICKARNKYNAEKIAKKLNNKVGENSIEWRG